MKHSATPSLPQPQQQPVSILRRSSTGGAASSKYTTFNNSNNNNSFHGDVNNSHLSLNSSAPNLNSNSNFTPITDPNELADRLLGFQRSYARSSSGGNNVATAYQSPISARRHRSPPRATPPPPLRPTSSGRPRSQLMSPSAKDPKHNQQQRRNSDKSWSDEAVEEDYVRRMATIKLDKSDRSIRGSASSSEYCFDGFQSEEMNASSTPTPPNCDKNGRCKLHPQYKLYKKKLLGGYEFISSCPMCFAASLDELHATSAKSPSASSKMSGRNSNRTTHSRERGRSTSANRMPIDPGLDEDDNYYGTSIRGRLPTRSGNNTPAKSPAATMSRRRNSRSRERGRSKSANRIPIVPNLDLDEGDDYATSKAKADPGLRDQEE